LTGNLAVLGQEPGCRNPERLRDATDVVDRDVAFQTLDIAYIGSVKLAAVSEFFLGPALHTSQPTHIACQNASQGRDLVCLVHKPEGLGYEDYGSTGDKWSYPTSEGYFWIKM